MNYNYKGEAALVFEENKKRLRLEGRLVLDRVLNEVLREMSVDFQDGVLRGEILSVGGSASETRAYFTTAAQRALGARS